VQSLHELADVYRRHSAMVAMLIVPSVTFTDATVTCPGGKNRRRIGTSNTCCCNVSSEGGYKLYGLFVPRTIRTLDYLYYGWTIRTLDDSYDGLFVRWTIRTMDCSYHL